MGGFFLRRAETQTGVPVLLDGEMHAENFGGCCGG